MRTVARLTTLAALLAPAATALAQKTATIGREIPDDRIEIITREGEKERYYFREFRGGIAVFYFWRPMNQQSVQVLKEIDALRQKFGDRGVRFISVTPTKKEQFEEWEKNNEVPKFQHYVFGNILHHVLGAYSEPYVVLVDPRGILTWRGVPDRRLEQRLADLIEYTRPPIGDKTWLSRRYREAERFHDRGEYGRAYTLARDLYEMLGPDHADGARAKALMDRCEAGAQKQLEEALQAERNKEYEKAARLVAEISVRFQDPDEERQDERGRGGGSGREGQKESIKRKAELEIGRMNSDRDLKKLIRDARNNAEAELLNDRALYLEQDDYYVEAKHIYEKVIADYKDTDAAREARERLKRIEQDKRIQEKIAERRARDQAIRWLDLGDRFAALKLYDEARDYYERLLREHPNTLAATRARERLQELAAAKTATESGSGARTP